MNERMHDNMKQWTPVWTSAPSRCDPSDAQWGCDVTLRYGIYTAVSGDRIRLRLSNLHGKHAVTVGRVSVARYAADGKKIDTATVTPVTFDGGREAAMEPGGGIVSDPVDFAVESGKSFALTMYLDRPTELTTSVAAAGPLCGKQVAAGDFETAAELPAVRSISSLWYRLTDAVEVETDAPVTVCFGDSITAQSWPDHLALATKGRAVVRRAVSGTRVLRAYDCLTYQSYGDKGADRFEREVCMPGVDSVLIMHGVNDLIHPDGVNPYRPLCDLPTAEELIEGLRFYIRTAHAHGIKVYLMTILPFGGWRTFTAEKEAIRVGVNEWILHADEPDGFVDAAGAVCDPDHPEKLAAAFDSGDHLHPSDGGARAIAAAVGEALPFLGR